MALQVFRTPEVTRVYISSFWNVPYADAGKSECILMVGERARERDHGCTSVLELWTLIVRRYDTGQHRWNESPARVQPRRV